MTGLATLGAEAATDTEGFSDGIVGAATCCFKGYFLLTGFMRYSF